MDSAEFAEWMLEYRCEPWGERRADLRMGRLAATLANLHRTLRETLLAIWVKGWRGKENTPFTPQDFMPNFEQITPTEQPSVPTPQPQNAAQLQAFFLNLTRQVGGTVH